MRILDPCIIVGCGSRCMSPAQFALPGDPRWAWLFAGRPLRSTRARCTPALSRGSRFCREALTPRTVVHGWRSLSRTLPTSDVPCRFERTAPPAPADWQLYTLEARPAATHAGKGVRTYEPRRLPSYSRSGTHRVAPMYTSRSPALFVTDQRGTPRTRSPFFHRRPRQFYRRDGFRRAMPPAFADSQRCVRIDDCFPTPSEIEHPCLVVSRADAPGHWRFTTPTTLRRIGRFRPGRSLPRACRSSLSCEEVLPIEPLTPPREPCGPPFADSTPPS